jgi:hypothetical protein
MASVGLIRGLAFAKKSWSVLRTTASNTSVQWEFLESNSKISVHIKEAYYMIRNFTKDLRHLAKGRLHAFYSTNYHVRQQIKFLLG